MALDSLKWNKKYFENDKKKNKTNQNEQKTQAKQTKATKNGSIGSMKAVIPQEAVKGKINQTFLLFG